MLFFTPLEQFDEVVWLSHRVIETLEPYILFISEIEFGAGHLYNNVYGTASSSTSTFASIFQVESEVFFYDSIWTYKSISLRTYSTKSTKYNYRGIFTSVFPCSN